MAKLIKIEKIEENKEKYCSELENGNILFFPKIPFDFSLEDREFLLLQKQSGSKSRKNIAYKPHLDKITNIEKESSDFLKMHQVMKSYSTKACAFVSDLLSPYGQGLTLDYASFRPFQEKGRNLRQSARNDLLHVDSFPTRPVHGQRILRFFTNINPTESRKWITSSSFKELALKFGGSRDLPFPKQLSFSPKERLIKLLKQKANSFNLKIPMRSPYDDFMIRMHHFLKNNKDFQNGKKDPHEFAPNSCWMVYTDLVTHAALSGQYALEQTFLVSNNAQLRPEKAPVNILQRLMGYSAIDTDLLEFKS